MIPGGMRNVHENKVFKSLFYINSRPTVASFSVWLMCQKWDFYFDSAENASTCVHGAPILLKVPYCTPFWSFILGFDILKNIYLRYKYQKPS